MTSLPMDRPSDRPFFIVNGVVSAAAVSLIAYLLLIHKGDPGGVDLRFMPAVNASLNATAACLLTAAFVAVKRRALKAHQYLMLSALGASALFLVGYLAYHFVHGDTKYPAGASLRGLYLFILASHVLLSIAVVPLVFTALYFAWRKEFERHRRVTRVTLPLWLYVSVTGVLVFFMLRWAGALPAARGRRGAAPFTGVTASVPAGRRGSRGS
jgi:putative membrane protein